MRPVHPLRILLMGLALLARPAAAVDYAWLIGGGPDLENSQAQIEQNVIWARDIIRGLPGERQLRVYFTDGNHPNKDVKEWQPPPETPAVLQPLARIFNSYWSNGESYRNHRLGEVTGSTEAGLLRRELSEAFEALLPGDRVLLVFSGHGNYDAHDTRRNSIALWDNTELTVADMADLLSRVPKEVPVRFVFTQCYSGAFAHLVDAQTNRCGFMAEAEDREAEGCSASVEMGDYRDYSTFFFAALAGKTRQGRPLDEDPDRNADGHISLREAHLYALLTSHSTDLPRSTSEVYLEDWQPWYLAWAQGLGAGNAGEYSRLAKTLTRRQGIEPDTSAGPRLQARRRELGLQRAALMEEQARIGEEIPRLRTHIEVALLRRWPEASYAYTRNYQRFLDQDLEAAQGFILGHPDYPALTDRQDRYWKLEDALLENERALTQIDKIERMQRLSGILGLFLRLASDEDRRAYRRLVDCEEQGP